MGLRVGIERSGSGAHKPIRLTSDQRGGSPNVVTSPAAPTRPNWSELTATEQQALAPLKTLWPSISAAQKRKWQAIAKNFSSLSGDEQTKLHARVQEWAQPGSYTQLTLPTNQEV